MDRLPGQYTLEEFDQVRSVIEEVGVSGPFTMDDFLDEYMQQFVSALSGEPLGPASIDGIFHDLCDIDVIQALGGSPPRWELCRTSAA